MPFFLGRQAPHHMVDRRSDVGPSPGAMIIHLVPPEATCSATSRPCSVSMIATAPLFDVRPRRPARIHPGLDRDNRRLGRPPGIGGEFQHLQLIGFQTLTVEEFAQGSWLVDSSTHGIRGQRDGPKGRGRVRPAQSLDLRVERRVGRALRAGNARPADADEIGRTAPSPPTTARTSPAALAAVRLRSGVRKCIRRPISRRDRTVSHSTTVESTSPDVADDSGCPQVRRHRVFQRQPLGLDAGQVGPQPQFGG